MSCSATWHLSVNSPAISCKVEFFNSQTAFDPVASADSNPLDLQTSRYARQMRFAPLGVEGQRKLLASRALVVGCGALGSVIANTLARAGVGKLRIVDRDFLELNNLQRQVLYDEDDVAAGLPKAIAAKNRLEKINSSIEIEAVVADVDHANIERLLTDVDCLVDGTDNFETRFLLNDATTKLGIPWVYGGCLGAEATRPCSAAVMPCSSVFPAVRPFRSNSLRPNWPPWGRSPATNISSGQRSANT